MLSPLSHPIFSWRLPLFTSLDFTAPKRLIDGLVMMTSIKPVEPSFWKHAGSIPLIIKGVGVRGRQAKWLLAWIFHIITHYLLWMQVSFSELPFLAILFSFWLLYTTSPCKEFLTTVFHYCRTDPKAYGFSYSLLTSREFVNIFQNNSPTQQRFPKGPRRKTLRRGQRARNHTSGCFPRLPPPSSDWSCFQHKPPIRGDAVLHLKTSSPSRLRWFFWWV